MKGVFDKEGSIHVDKEFVMGNSKWLAKRLIGKMRRGGTISQIRSMSYVYHVV